MIKKILISFLAATQIAGPAAAYSIDDGQFYYRYKATVSAETGISNPETKDITAHYIGGVGRAFSEKLPMKPQWEDDNWVVTSGVLPDGITFNSSTLTFEGVPQSAVTDAIVELSGFDASGNDVASAIAHFSTYHLPDQVVDVDIYNHTGKYGSYALNLPSGLVIDGDPKLLSTIPPGVSFNARYFEGTPSQAGVYPVLAFGYDYLGEAVVAFTGHYTVEDTPTFAEVKDDLVPLERHSYYGCYSSKECRVWPTTLTPKIKRAIKDFSKVRYQVEVQEGSTLPGSLHFHDGPYDLRMTGMTYQAFDQATIRYKATDTDGSVGYSNWFKIGSLGLTGVCQPQGSNPSITLSGSVGAPLNGTGYKIPTGLDTGNKTFTITGGELPSGLSLDRNTGLISGTFLKEEYPKGLTLRIDYPDAPDAAPTLCGPYDFNVIPASTSLIAEGGKAHYRLAEAVDIELKPTGAAIDPWTITMDEGVLPSGVHFDEASHRLIGIVNEVGNFSANFTYTNGDGNSYKRSISFAGHSALSIDDVASSFSIKKYDITAQLVAFSYDTKTPIEPGSETFTLIGGPLPDGLVFDPYTLDISGGTHFPENRYGPFRVRLSDATGQSDETNDFFVDVTARNDIISNETVDPLTFSLNLEDKGQLAFSVTQPPLAKTRLPLSYALTPSVLPAGLVFDETTGLISGKPTAKGEIHNYQLTVSEISPDNLAKTSEPFSIVIKDAPPISERSLPKLSGNVGGPLVSSVSPAAILKGISKELVGGVDAVVYEGISPVVNWLSFDKQNGTASGIPTEEYQGVFAINYHDDANRPGKLSLPVVIHPYPQLKPLSESFELPRLSQAAEFKIGVEPANSGFYGGVTYQLAPASAKLPSGLSLTNGVITGTTSAPSDTTAAIVIRATSVANGIVVDYPLTLKVVPELPMSLDIVPNDKLMLRIDGNTGALGTPRGWFTKPAPAGSFVAPVTWSLKNHPSWMSIGNDGQIYGTPPSLGEWIVKVVATDQEKHSAEDEVTIKATLTGLPVVTEADGALAVTEEITVRTGETFETKAKVATNAVNPWEWLSENRPDTLSLDQPSGKFTGRINESGITTWRLNVSDADGRQGKSPVKYSVRTVPPLSVPSATFSQNGRQYDPRQPIEVKFSPAQNVMGKVSYGIAGDLPGTLYYKVYDNDDPTALATYIHMDDFGQTQTVRQPFDYTAERVENELLPPDNFVFDSLALTLKGVANRSGTFSLSMIASDDHENAGYQINPSDPTRAAYNTAQTAQVTVNASPAAELEIANSATSEALSQFTSAPLLTTTVVNHAYGRQVTWRAVSGDLPSGLGWTGRNNVLSYTGYADSQGSWTNIVWEGTDAAGRKIVSDPVAFTVGPRQPLSLVSSPKVPRAMIVFDQDADLSVTARNVADGKSIGKANWTVSGAGNLPPGVTYTISDSGVHFTGTSNVIGTYSGITVSAKDSRNATTSIALTFNVIANPAAIVLNVSDIKTKPGFPIEMRPPFAATTLSTSNTYGDVRFYSNDLTNIPGISLDGATGFLTGTVGQPTGVTFDLFVTDDTNRVTSKPVTAEVIPYLRLIVPTIVDVEQGEAALEAIATDYVLGTVFYEKGAGNWPSGLAVDPLTGAVTGTTSAATGEYPGLTIVGTDTFGAFKDVQSSNAFTIRVSPTPALPVISDIANNRLIIGMIGKASVPFTPTVIDSKAGKPWNYSGTVYSLSHTLPAGLSFDSQTGRISGTPTEIATIPNMVMTVKSQSGDTDSTAPFVFEVQPLISTLRLTINSGTHAHVCMGYAQLFVDGVDVFPQATLTSSPYGYGTHPENLKDPSLIHGGKGNDGGLLCWSSVKAAWLDIAVPSALSSGEMKLYQRNDTWKDAYFTNVSISRKNDDGTFTELVRMPVTNAGSGQVVTVPF